MSDELKSLFAAPRCGRAEDLGAYLLGGLDDAAALDLRRHVDGCAVCSEEIHQLRPVVDALAGIPADLDVEDDDVPVQLGDRLLARAAAEQRQHRRARNVVAFAAALLLLVGSVTVTRALSGGSKAPVRVGERIDLASAIPSATGLAFLDERSSGTYLELQARNLPAGKYRMWFQLADGTRIAMGSFRSNGGPELLHCPGSSDLARTDLYAVGATNEQGDDVLTAKLQKKGVLRPY